MTTIFPGIGTTERYEVTTSTTQEDVSFEGINQHFGFLWEITDSLTLGGVYKTAFDADLRKNQSTSRVYDTCTSTTNFFGIPSTTDCSGDPLYSSTLINNIMRMPPSYGLGLAYRHSDSLTLAFDVYMTEWSRFVIREADNNEINPLTNNSIDEGRLKDTVQVRTGAEYLFIGGKYAVPVRAGRELHRAVGLRVRLRSPGHTGSSVSSGDPR